MQRTSRRWLFVLGGSSLCMVVALLAFFYLDYITARAMPTIPIVSITETFPESPVVADQSVIVFGQASDPDGIAEVQLWVNGRMVASQTNTDRGSAQPFNVSHAWIPTGAANYLVLLRAIDGKGYAGQSDPLLVEAAERSYTYEVKPGETVKQIAEEFGTTPEDLQERNPGMGDAPAPGTSLDVPAAPAGDGGSSGGAPPAGGEAEEPPRVDPPVPPPPPSGDETPAEPLTPVLVILPPFIPDNFRCLIEPELCLPPGAGGGGELIPPTNVAAVLNDSCQVLITWQDATDYEVGFRVYRAARGPFRVDMVAMLQASPGIGGRLSYLDESPPNQELFYFVAAYNAAGVFLSALSERITVTCHPPESTASMILAVEALEMSVRDPYDRLYCYASLAGSPFERVPHASFLELEGAGFWNIAEHFSGQNKRTILNVDMTPVDIVVECLGWSGGTLVNLGRFHNTHPAEEWDGHPLTGSSPDGSFTVTYHIQYAREVASGTGGSEFRLIDTSYPSPFNLRAINYWQRCDDPLGSGVMCNRVNEPGLEWDYPLERGRNPDFFRVYLRKEDESAPRLYFESFRGYMFAPQTDDCSTDNYYSVSAVVGSDPVTGETIESFPSAELEVQPSCSQLEITLTGFEVTSAPDGDPGTDFCVSDCGSVVEAYGWFRFNGRYVRWNDHCDPGFGGGCLTSGPSYTDVAGDLSTNYFWPSQYLSPGHRFQIPIEEGRPLTVIFGFSDHDFMSPDDFWCGWHSTRSYNVALPARSLGEWRAIDQDVYVESPDHNCGISFHVRGAR